MDPAERTDSLNHAEGWNPDQRTLLSNFIPPEYKQHLLTVGNLRNTGKTKDEKKKKIMISLYPNITTVNTIVYFL